MPTTISKDGTTIAYSVAGSGPALILVDGALCYREFGPSKALAALLAKNFTVYTYDRRGRGESGDTAPYGLDREIEDIDALIKVAEGSAYVYGISSGAALALEAASRGLPITKLALYEAPFMVDDSREPISADYLTRLRSLIASDRRSDALRLFMKSVGAPAIFVAFMRVMPAWSKLKAVAHTLPYDISIVHENQRGNPLPAGRWNGLVAPTLVVDGGKSPTWMRNAARALAAALNAKYRTLEGQTHMVKAQALAPVLTEFFAS